MSDRTSQAPLLMQPDMPVRSDRLWPGFVLAATVGVAAYYIVLLILGCMSLLAAGQSIEASISDHFVAFALAMCVAIALSWLFAVALSAPLFALLIWWPARHRRIVRWHFLIGAAVSAMVVQIVAEWLSSGMATPCDVMMNNCWWQSSAEVVIHWVRYVGLIGVSVISGEFYWRFVTK
jgi:hypothetical protein